MCTERIAQTSRKKRWGRYVLVSIIATLMLLGAKSILEHTSWGHEYQLWVFGKLQGSLSPIDVDNPIVVLDIGSLPGGRRFGEPTPRKPLEEIIGALAEVQPYPPRAIAVDINFSPKGPIPASDEDEEFFDFCLSITNDKRIPVFLGVGETKSAPPEARLGNALYKDLAVAIVGNKNDTSRIPLWVKGPDSPEPLNTLNYALALEYRKRLAGAPDWIDWALETNVDAVAKTSKRDEVVKTDTLTYANRLVNYSKLDQLKLAAQTNISAEGVHQAAAKYSNKLVILGDLASDLVPVPGRVHNEPGSLVLASATYTLIKEPLFEFKWWVRLLLDVLIAGAIIAAVAVIRHRNPEGHPWVGKQAFFVYVAVLLVLIVGWKLVSWVGVLWLDFLLVAFALLLHPKVEHQLDRLFARTAKPEQNVNNTTLGTGNAVAGLIVILMASPSAFAQARAVDPPPCERNAAAVGVQLSTSKGKPKKKKLPTCYVRENKSSKWQSLTATDVRRQYRAGQHLYCDEDCSLTLFYCGTKTRHVVNVRYPKWYPIINAYRIPPELDDSNSDTFGRTSLLYSPVNPDPRAETTRGRSSTGEVAGFIAARRGGGLAATRPRPSSEETAGVSRAPASTSDTASTRPSATTSGVTTPAGRSTVRGAVRPTERVAEATTSGERPSVTGPARPAKRSAAVPTTAPVRDSATSSAASDFIKLLVKGNDARRRGDYPVARQAYLDAQALDPGDYRALEGLGNIFADQDDWSAAEQAYRDALKASGYNVRLYASLAVVMLKQLHARGDKSRAQEVEEILRVAALTDPENETVHALLEELFELQGTEPAVMEPIFRRAVTYTPESTKANLRLARVLYQLGWLGEAKTFLRRAERNAVGPDHVGIARVYEANGQYKDAERALRRARAWSPADPVVLYTLGRVLVQRRDFGAALHVLRAARQADPTAFAPVLLFAMAQLEKGDLRGAEVTFNDASIKVQQQPGEQQRLGYWFAELGDKYHSKRKFAEAIRVYEKSLSYSRDREVEEKLSDVQRRYAASPARKND